MEVVAPRPAIRRRAAFALLALIALLLLPASAHAAPSTPALTAIPTSPSAGEEVTFTAASSDDCGVSYAFTIDGQPPPAGSTATGATLTTTFATPGTYSVAVTATSNDPCSGSSSKSIDFVVNRVLGGTIDVAPDPPVVNQSAELSASQTGGKPGYSYTWDSDNDGAFDDSTERTITTTFTTTGPHVVRVRIQDEATPIHEIVVTRTLDVVEPKPDDPPPPPTPPQCVKTLAFALSEFTTGGCFTFDSSGRWVTTSSVKLNGIVFKDFGQKFYVTQPTTSEPGGHFSALDSTIKLGATTVFSGDIDWELPAGEQGGEEEVKALTIPPAAQLFGLRLSGSTALRIGFREDGTHYALFGLNVNLPAIFAPGPGGGGRVTGETSIRVDDAGVHYDGLKITVQDVWVGRIKVPEACFSYVPAGGTAVSPCDAPTLDGEPYIVCADDTDTNRWDGNAVLELPVDGAPQYAAFGGFADGKLTKLGGFADNLGFSVALAPGVFLKRIGAGVCLSPPPLKIRGDVGVEALGGKLRLDGRVVYTDDDGGRPWSLEVGGKVSLAGSELGRGSVTFDGWGDVDFGLSTDLDLLGVGSVEGEVNGWFQPRLDRFNVTGRVKGCIVSVLCAEASGVISNVGVAGCLDAGEIVLYEPAGSRQGPFGFGSISVSLRKRVIQLKAGIGYVFGTSDVDLLGNSCDFAPYSSTKGEKTWTARVAAVSTPTTSSQRIEPGTKAVALRVHGTNGPPKIVVRGPDGTVIVSPSRARGKRVKGKYLLAENKTDGTTGVLLIKPAAGTWTISAAPGAKSKPTTVDRSGFTGPPTFAGMVQRSGKRHAFVMAYAVPANSTINLIETGKGVNRTIATDVHGRPCRDRHILSGDRKLMCVRVDFTPAPGPGGTRRIQAVVNRGATPLAQTNVASYRVAAPKLPSRPGALSARRTGGALVVAFPPTSGAARYSVIAELSDGRKLGFDLAAKCRAVKIPSVGKDITAIVRIAGVRVDLRTGKYRAVRLGKGKTSTGPAGLLPRPVCS